MMTILTIKCSSSTTAAAVVSEVQAGALWGVDLGTTSKVASQSNYVLIECTNTRNLALLDACPMSETCVIEYSLSDPDSFGQTDAVSKSWFLRGRL
tara:strand:+ start:458 stop:745 length:288 start_codon:yes stop_codon:yes gene_type:complete